MITTLSLLRKRIDDVDLGEFIALDSDTDTREVADIVFNDDDTLGGYLIEFEDGTTAAVALDAEVYVEVED